jgi:hypothetical protein
LHQTGLAIPKALFDPTQTGVTLLEIDRWTLAEELWSFGEDSLYCEPLRMDDEAMIRVWVLAGSSPCADQHGHRERLPRSRLLRSSKVGGARSPARTPTPS